MFSDPSLRMCRSGSRKTGDPPQGLQGHGISSSPEGGKKNWTAVIGKWSGCLTKDRSSLVGFVRNNSAKLLLSPSSSAKSTSQGSEPSTRRATSVGQRLNE